VEEPKITADWSVSGGHVKIIYDEMTKGEKKSRGKPGCVRKDYTPNLPDVNPGCNGIILIRPIEQTYYYWGNPLFMQGTKPLMPDFVHVA